MVLYDGSFFIIDLQSMEYLFYGNISTTFSGFSKERDHVNVIFQKNNKESCVIISHNISVNSYDWKTKRDICLHKFEDQVENYIRNLSMSTNQALLVVLTYNGNVYVFDIEICWLKLRTLWSKNVIEQFSNIPNVLRDFLLFKSMRD